MERVVENVLYPAISVIAARVVSSDGKCMEKRGVRRGQPVFDGIGSKGHRLQAREDLAPNRPLAGICSLGFDWWERPDKHPLVALQGSWLRDPSRGEHCTTVLEEDKESQRFSPSRLTLSMTDRKKSRLSVLPTRGSSCVMVRLCLPGPRLTFDQINCWCWDIRLSFSAFNRCGVEPSIDTLKKPEFGPRSP